MSFTFAYFSLLLIMRTTWPRVGLRIWAPPTPEGIFRDPFPKNINTPLQTSIQVLFPQEYDLQPIPPYRYFHFRSSIFDVDSGGGEVGLYL